MTNLKNVQLEDIERLAYEISGYTGDAEEWAEKVGLDPEVVNGVGNVATNMAYQKTMEVAREAFEESGLTEDDIVSEDGEMSMAMKMDIGEVIKSACISTFVLGFETHKQYGGGGAQG